MLQRQSRRRAIARIIEHGLDVRKPGRVSPPCRTGPGPRAGDAVGGDRHAFGHVGEQRGCRIGDFLIADGAVEVSVQAQHQVHVVQRQAHREGDTRFGHRDVRVADAERVRHGAAGEQQRPPERGRRQQAARATAFAAAMLLALSTPAAAQMHASSPKTVAASRTDSALVVDGRLTSRHGRPPSR